MARIFLSHSSKDKRTAHQLAADLKQVGHDVWIDEENIVVGQGIASGIQDGLKSCDFILLVLSKHSVESKWVEREWQSRYAEDISASQPLILPVLIDDCQIPTLLSDKKYADFRKSYAAGFVELCRALDVLNKVETKSAGIVSTQPDTPIHDDVTQLLSQFGDPSITLAALIPKALAVARKVNDTSLIEYCQVQIIGLNDKPYSLENLPLWAESRAIKTYVSLKGPLNPSYIGWNGNVQNIWNHISSSPDFKWFRVIVPDPIHWIEKQAELAQPDTLLTGSLPVEDFVSKPKDPTARLTAYMRYDAYQDVCVRIRQDISRMLSQYV